MGFNPFTKRSLVLTTVKNTASQNIEVHGGRGARDAGTGEYG